jgi:hypothetical protein
VLAEYKRLEDIPREASKWHSSLSRGAQRLASNLQNQWDNVLLYRKLATLRDDVPVWNSLEDLLWKGPSPSFEATCTRLKALDLYKRANAVMSRNTV